MNCSDLSEDLLLDLARGELELDRVMAVREHLDGCPACSARFEETKSMVALLDRAARHQEMSLTPSRIERVVEHAKGKARPDAVRTTERLRRTKTVPMAVRRPQPQPTNVLAIAGGLAAAAAVLIAVVMNSGGPPPPRTAAPSIARSTGTPPGETPPPVAQAPFTAPRTPEEAFTFRPSVPTPAPGVETPPAPGPSPVLAGRGQETPPTATPVKPSAPSPEPAPAVARTPEPGVSPAPKEPATSFTQAVVAPVAGPPVPVTDILGTLRVQPAGADAPRDVAAGETLALKPGDRLIAGGVSRVTVGYRHRLYLNTGTRAGLRQDGEAVRVSLAAGEVLADVASADPSKRAEVFSVETPHGTAHVRGTRFDVRLEEKRAFVAVAEGTVVCRGIGRGEVSVTPGQEAELRGASGVSPAHKTAISDIGVWFRAIEAFVWVEAETGEAKGGAETAADPSASGGRFLRAAADDGGIGSFTFRAPRPGQYRLWTRVRNGIKRADFSVRLDEGPHLGMQNDYAAPDWHWMQGPLFDVADGERRITMWFSGKGACVDQMVLTTDDRFVPRDEPVAPAKPGRKGAAAPAHRIVWDPLDRRSDALVLAPPCSDGPYDAGQIGGAAVVRATPPAQGPHYLYFRVNDRIWKDRRGAATLRVQYHAPSGGDFVVEYDSADSFAPYDGANKRADGADGSAADAPPAGPSPAFTERDFTFPDARFANRQNSGADFRIAVPEGKSLLVRGVALEWAD